ncbi:uncharacterized protein [Danio rerio]|uniref:Uncharacterized protein n=1 Tax=Danio rerio TaxID=7955 RepID=A0AC58JCD1_DANRE
MILDVRTRWNSLFLMVERFLEQYPAIQAASLDQRLRKTMEKDNEKSPTCGQIFPILAKLEEHFKVAEEETMFISTLKVKVWEDLEKRYQDEDIKNFLQEATLMNPRFKSKLECAVAADAWGRLEKAPVDSATAEPVFYPQSYFPSMLCYSFYNKVLLLICATSFLQLLMEHNFEEESEDRLDDNQEDESLNTEEHSPYHKIFAKKSALEELFENED